MDNEKLNSCIMLAVGLHTPIDLDSFIDEFDLSGPDGIEIDSHITVLYAKEQVIPSKEVLADIETILGDDKETLYGMFKEPQYFQVYDLFDLDRFTGGESDYLILKLKKDNFFYDTLSTLNKGLSRKYGVESDFADYTPHITLAELKPGKGAGYVRKKVVDLVMSESVVGFEDFVFSLGTKEEKEDRLQKNLTTFNAVPRHFRKERAIKEKAKKEK